MVVESLVGKVTFVGLEWQFTWGRVPALCIAIKLPRIPHGLPGLLTFFRLKKSGAWGCNLC